MANSLYTKAHQHFVLGDIAWGTDTIKVVLVDGADYTPNLATHEYLSAIPVAARVATSPGLTGKVAPNGVADSDDVTINTVTGDQFEYLVFFKDTGDPATSPLIALFDTAYGMPFVPTGGSITITMNNSATKIFGL